MPELPEVETVRRFLDARLPGKRIRRVTVSLSRLLKNRTEAVFVSSLEGRAFGRVERRGKYLLLRLDGPESLLVHLRMTGSLVYEPLETPAPRHSRIEFLLTEGVLRYGDVRTLGCLWLVPAEGPSGIPGYDTLGPDAIGEAFTGEWLCSALSKSKRPVKAVILDQSVVAGVGNIYADEALFLAGVRPDRPSCGVTPAEAARLCGAVRAVMAESLAAGGTTFRNFVDAEGKEGRNVANLRVYGRDGQPCPACGRTIELTRVAGRGTRFCPACQK